MKYIIISFISIISFLFSEQKNTTDIWFRNVPNPQTGEPVIFETLPVPPLPEVLPEGIPPAPPAPPPPPPP